MRTTSPAHSLTAFTLSVFITLAGSLAASAAMATSHEPSPAPTRNAADQAPVVPQTTPAHSRTKTLRARLDPNAADVIGSRLLAVPHPDATPQEISAAVEQIGLGAKLAVNPTTADPRTLVEVTVPTSTARQIADQMATTGLFLAVDFDQVAQSAAYTPTPNDPYFTSPTWGWNLKATPGASFNTIWGKLATAAGPATAPIAVIDSGYWMTHEDLTGSSAIPVWDYGQNRASVTPVAGSADQDHGTGVLGVIAATPDNAKGITGAAWDTKTLLYKDTDALGNTLASATANAFFAATGAGAKVINCSCAFSYLSTTMEAALADADAKG
ncbi:MAG: S8 family serine peptidase, partial [Micrococcales bacterium]|nr:S8 family serine peptidase [Micrococcales bacterium]